MKHHIVHKVVLNLVVVVDLIVHMQQEHQHHQVNLFKLVVQL
jgi:hypothetical protein